MQDSPDVALQPYNFTVEHRKRKDNANADMLSRLPQESDHGFAIKKEGRNVSELEAESYIDPCRPCGGIPNNQSEYTEDSRRLRGRQVSKETASFEI